MISVANIDVFLSEGEHYHTALRTTARALEKPSHTRPRNDIKGVPTDNWNSRVYSTYLVLKYQSHEILIEIIYAVPNMLGYRLKYKTVKEIQ